MLKKFPFSDSLLKNLGILLPDKARSYDVSVVSSLAKRFPQLGLTSSEAIDHLKEEFTDFLLSPMDIESPSTYKASEPNFSAHHAPDKVERPCAGSFWWRVGKMKTVDGEPRFPTLCRLMAGLLSIPCSNADSERGFSILRKIHTDQRANLDHSTIVSLMSFKINTYSCCFNTKLPEELLSKSKKATYLSLH